MYKRQEDIGFHNIANTGFIGGQEHSLDGDYAEQDTVLGNIAGIHSLLVQSDTADAGKGLLHCGVWMEVYELCGHNGTGGVLGIIEKLIDLAAGRGIGIPQNTDVYKRQPITREQLALILYGYAQMKEYDTTQGGMSIREFSDYTSISGWALEGLDWAVNAGLLSGKGNNTLVPTAGATRAEVAQIFMMFCQEVAKQSK